MADILKLLSARKIGPVQLAEVEIPLVVPKPGPNFEAQFTKLVNILAPPLPEAVGGAKLRGQINAVLAPTLLKKAKILPPMPKFLARIVEK
ncbi:unnamed protein product [marine sediment metagenome]|uniref:Uncharacterized protein n=1 Tax=marine sediment metagenome TaxID=412755 RepID=X1RLB4_9ZZZZ